MQIIDEELPQKISDATATMPLSQAKQIYTAYKNKELAMPYEIPEEHQTEKVVLGTIQRWGQSLEVVPEGLGILGGEIMMLDGKILQHTPFKNIAQSEMKLGEKMIMGANSSLMAKRKRQAQELLPMTEEESSSVLSKSISTVTDYGSQILLALATGGTTALATMGARMAGETAVAGLEEYKQAHPEDKDLTGFLTTGKLSKEVLLNAGKTAINLYVEKAIGVPKQVSQFKEALKTPVVGATGVLKAAGKGYAMGFGEEWATETIQGISDTTFDAFLGRFKDMPELAKAYNESVVDAVYAGIFGGGFGATGHVMARGKAIGQVKQMMSNVVPEQDLEMVATAIVDNHIASTKQLIGTQVQLSTQLRDKHGEIFNAMNAAAKQAMMESGVANTMTEDEIAQHAVELSTLFADQVLAEANKRNVPIMDVIQGQDIVYDPKTKELRLAPKTEESNAKRVFMQSAYHGGPELEGGKFDLKFAQKAHGQTHGHGVYSTPVRTIANKYRIDFDEDFSVDGKKLSKIYSELSSNKEYEKAEIVADLLANQDLFGLREGRDQYDKNAWKWFEKEIASKLESKGKLYELDIPEDMNLIDEQKTFDEQSEVVRFELLSAIQRINGYGLLEKAIESNAKGAELYDALGRDVFFDKNGFEGGHTETQKAASEYLSKHNIKGIKYFDNGAGFVIFNTDDVKIVQKFYQDKANPKGTFDSGSKVIQLFEKADASTLDHELAHFWLDNMWTYANSGAASDAYKEQFNAVKNFLGVRPDQMYLTYNQHEKFASAYEKYIHRGIIPNSIMGNVFDNYERFIRNVYDSINDIMYTTKRGQKKAFKLTPEIIKFFDSMIRGGIDTTAATDLIASEVRNEEAQKADDVTMKESKEVVANMPEREVQPETKPVETEGKAKESRLYERMKGIVGDEGKLEYNVVEIKEQREKARNLWKENPEKARAILNGTEQAEDILRQALYTEQQRLALQNGDTNTFLTSLRKQSAEATRMGQELSALRGVVEDITDPAYWIRSAETEALKNLAKKQTKNLENAMGNSPLMELTARLDADIKALQKDVASKATDEEKMKALKDGVKSIAEKYQGLEQHDTVFNQIDWDNEELANDYIENKVKEKLGIALPKDTAKAFIQTARELDTLSRQRDEMGNPVDAFFAKKDELERMRNSHTPTARTKVLISTIGRANMLTAPATSVLNVVSNSLNYGAENVVRKVGNILDGKTNDNIVSKDLKDKYRAKAWKVFWETGYDMSFMTSLLDERLYKGESISHSEGDGAIRAVGRWAEKYVFSRLISTPDIYIKSVIGFTDYVGNEATDVAYKEGLTGEKAKARADELFKDAIKIEPETEQGKQIRAKAQTDALVLTFQQDTKFARMLLDVRNAINKGTGDIGIGDILSPFIKTPANIISMGFDAAVGPFASPVNLIGALNDIKAKNYRSARVLQAARQTTTAALAYTVIALLASMLIDDDDYIPDYAQLTQKERAAVRAKGGSFGSIRVGGEYISTDFFGPFEMPLVTFLNTRKTGNLLKGIAGGVISKGVDAPVLKDILGSSEALKEMATSKDDIISAVGENVANAAITRLTPNALNTIAKILDGKERKTNTIAEKLVSRIPFARQQLEEKISVATGEAQEIQALNTLLFGSRGKYEETAPLAKEISRLASSGEAVNIVDPTRSGILSKLSEQEKRNIQDIFAKEFAKKASKEITTASYNRKSDDGKKDALDAVRKNVVDDIKRKFRKQIKVLQKGK